MQIDMGLHYFNEHVFEPGCACTDGIRELGAWYTASSPAAIR